MELDTDGFVLCDCEDCVRKATMTSTSWPRNGQMTVQYWCAIHAPIAASWIDVEDDEDEQEDMSITYIIGMLLLMLFIGIIVLALLHGGRE